MYLLKVIGVQINETTKYFRETTNITIKPTILHDGSTNSFDPNPYLLMK